MQAKLIQRECNIMYSLLQAANMFVSAILSAFVVPLLVSQGFNAFEIGVLIAVKCVSMSVFAIIYASFADKLNGKISNREFIEFFCLSGIGATLIHVYLPMNMITAVLVFVLYGATFSCITTFTDSLSNQYMEKGIKINYAYARSAGSLFYAFAGIVLGVLTSKFSPVAILWLQIGALAICFIITFTMPNPNKFNAETKIKKVEKNICSVWKLLSSNIFYTVFLVASFFFMTGVNITMCYMSYTVERARGNSFDLGMTSFVLGICEVFVGFYFLKALKKFGSRNVVLIAMIGMALRVGALVFATNMMVVYVAQIFELIGCMLWAGNITLVQNEIDEGNRVKAIAIVSSIQTGFSVLGASLFGGYIMNKYNNAFYLHMYAFIFSLIGILIYILDIRVIKKK